MSRKPPPVFTRPSSADAERKLAELAERAEARGNAIAGQEPAAEAPSGKAAKAAAKASKLRREESGVRVAGYLPAELEQELRMHCARERRSVSDALTEAVRLLLDKAPKR
jgi:hypothetical protein